MTLGLKHDFTVGQIGARIILEIVRLNPITGVLAALDVSTATTKEITILKPDQLTKKVYVGGGVTFTQPPDGVGDGTDGLIEAATVLTTELSQPGTYQTQAYIIMPGEDGFTQTGTFTVGPVL